MNRAWMKWFLMAAMITASIPMMGLANGRRNNNSNGINGRQQHQQQRIRQGIRSGELTRRETARLEATQARIRVNETFARRSGGVFTARERLRIQRQLNHASRNIYRQKHDRQDRN